MVIQYNKRDLPDVVSIEELEEKVNSLNVPYFEAVAVKITGVFNTLKSISKQVINKYNKTSSAGASSEKFKKKSAAQVPDVTRPLTEKPVVAPQVKSQQKIQAIPQVEVVDDDIQNYINSKKLKSASNISSPSEIQKKVMDEKPVIAPEPELAKPKAPEVKLDPIPKPPKSDPFLSKMIKNSSKIADIKIFYRNFRVLCSI